MAGLFQSYFMGGFECATHRRQDQTQIDVIDGTRHDLRAAEDYRLLGLAGVRTVRDGLRWHTIETAPGVYDWSSFLPMLEASLATGTQVIWDLCHWGVPPWLDVFSPEFVPRFATFAGAAARMVRQHSDEIPFYCPINEISFWAWIGGSVGGFYPYQRDNAEGLKRQLVAASLAGMRAVRAVDRRARFVQAEPVIHVAPGDDSPGTIRDAERNSATQFEAWDMLRGDRDRDLGGSPDMLDIVGVNFYWNNQWINGADRIPLGSYHYKPLHVMLRELWERYGRPIVITETGAEAGAGVGWLGYIAAEVRRALHDGVPIEGICLYPVMDYPGWDDDRHCACGLIEVDQQWNDRKLRPEMVVEIVAQGAAMTAAQQVQRRLTERNTPDTVVPQASW